MLYYDTIQKLFYNQPKNNLGETKNIIKIDYTPNYNYETFDHANLKFVIDIEKLKAFKLKEIDQSYNQYILSLYPIEKQLKMTMQYNALLNKQINESLTNDELLEKTALENLHRWYKSMLEKHTLDKNYILSETDIEKLKIFKATLENV